MGSIKLMEAEAERAGHDDARPRRPTRKGSSFYRTKVSESLQGTIAITPVQLPVAGTVRPPTRVARYISIICIKSASCGMFDMSRTKKYLLNCCYTTGPPFARNR